MLFLRQRERGREREEERERGKGHEVILYATCGNFLGLITLDHDDDLFIALPTFSFFSSLFSLEISRLVINRVSELWLPLPIFASWFTGAAIHNALLACC